MKAVASNSGSVIRVRNREADPCDSSITSQTPGKSPRKNYSSELPTIESQQYASHPIGDFRKGRAMLLEGTIRNGTIVLDQPLEIPDGARVEVVIRPATQPSTSLGEMLLRHAGKAVGLPEDMAAQHDHYLRGTP